MEHVQSISVYLRNNGVDFWSFVRKACVFCVVALWLLSFSVGSAFGVKYGSTLALRSQIFKYLHESFVQKKMGRKVASSYGSTWPSLTFLKACGWCGHIFGASASPRSITNNGLCHSLSLLMAVSMILNMWHSSSYCMRHSLRTKFGAFSLNQPVSQGHNAELA